MLPGGGCELTRNIIFKKYPAFLSRDSDNYNPNAKQQLFLKALKTAIEFKKAANKKSKQLLDVEPT